MANRRRKYLKKKKKNKITFKTFFIIAIIIIASFFIWQLIITQPQKGEKESPIIIKKKTEGKKEKASKLSEKITKGSVESAIDYALQRLEIPKKFIKTYYNGSEIIKRITIDTNELSLPIANIFITDKVQEAEGQIISVKESKDGNSIRMKIFDPKIKKYFTLIIKNDQYNLYQKTTQLAILIDDFGYFSGELLNEFLALDKNINFAIIPELSCSRIIMQKAYNQGRETLIHIPMEPISYPKNDPGKNAIFVNLSENEIKRRTKKYIQNLPLCIGANNHMGSLVTQHRKVLAPVLAVLKENNLFFVDSNTTPKTIGYLLAKEMNIPTYLVDFFLDSDKNPERVEINTRRLLQLARTQNKIVVITHNNRKDLRELKQILRNIAGKNIKLVPISQIVLPKEYAGEPY